MRISPVFGPSASAIVLQVRAVGGADLDQLRAGARHDVRHAKRAADLDQLAARHDRLAAFGKRVEHQQHRGGIVVDERGVLRAGQFAEQAAHMIVALAALAADEVELQRDRGPHGADAPPRSRLRRGRARPRLVCSTVPVRLKTGRKFDCASAASWASAVLAMSSGWLDLVLPMRNATRVASRI